MRHALRAAALAALAICAVRTACTAQTDAWRRYVNVRFRFGVSYPAGVLAPRGESANGDGQEFAAADGGARMLAYGTRSLTAAEGSSLREGYADHLRELSRVTYKVLRRDWFVISGMHEGKIRYEKVMVKDGVFKVLLIEYDPDRRSRYDPIVAHISKTFASTR
ncbi:MAG: hypothetical protein JST22_13540 [Bacteroidetes bacterium]|nr:hypothetical protein [Bacteroidota bacterium]